jgi:protein SCO1/2
MFNFRARGCSRVASSALAAFVFVLLGLLWPRGVAATETKPVATAADFTLSDQYGHSFTLSHHRGRPVVLFFGYTHCPDVCPTILANLKSARTAIGPKGADILVALITVDPQRDTPGELGRFVSAFDPSFLGLTGTTAQLKPVYRAYHVRYEKQEVGAGGYLVSHTAFVYYIGRDGRVRGYGTWSDPRDILEEDLRAISYPKG